MVRLTLGEIDGTLTVEIRDLDIEANEISLMSWEAPEMLKKGITPEDRTRNGPLDLYIREIAKRQSP